RRQRRHCAALRPAAARPSCRRESRDPRTRAEPRRLGPQLQACGLRRATARQIAYLKTLAGFLVACANALRQALTQRGVVSSREVFDVATEAGANAVPIVALVGFLMGVIIAFEIGLVARQFGAAVFVVDG